MTDRDRLIELIKQDTQHFTNPFAYEYGDDSAELFADYLLANCVIVPIRCKDCEYYTPIKHQSIKWKSKTFYCTRNANMKMNENDFCSCAKLKELNDNG